MLQQKDAICVEGILIIYKKYYHSKTYIKGFNPEII
ncbi:MAG: hypothetical protein JWQ54_1037 [Mucilaginibacter sp.]|nr:hypothetical protein [Mucilaginibacter sp.]